jgi:hypothetical protein
MARCAVLATNADCRVGAPAGEGSVGYDVAVRTRTTWRTNGCTVLKRTKLRFARLNYSLNKCTNGCIVLKKRTKWVREAAREQRRDERPGDVHASASSARAETMP